jgi:hypothetical protein
MGIYVFINNVLGYLLVFSMIGKSSNVFCVAVCTHTIAV